MPDMPKTPKPMKTVADRQRAMVQAAILQAKEICATSAVFREEARAIAQESREIMASLHPPTAASPA